MMYHRNDKSKMILWVFYILILVIILIFIYLLFVR
jgi:hypothetical protein